MTDDADGHTGGDEGRPNPRKRERDNVIDFNKIGETRGKRHNPERIKRAAEREPSAPSVARRGGTEREQRPIEKKAVLKGQGKGSRGVTAKQEAFALAVAQGATLSDAYRKAYDVGPDTKQETVWKMAYATSELQHVAERIVFHVERIEREKPHDDAATRRMVRDYLVGIVQDSGQRTSDRTKAAELLGKVGGVALFQPQVSPKGDKPSDLGALEERLRTLLDGVRQEVQQEQGLKPSGTEA